MKNIKLILIIYLYGLNLSAQELINSFNYPDGYSIVPKSINKIDSSLIIPYSIVKNNKKKAGLIYLNTDGKIKKSILFDGDNDYVINQIIKSDFNSNILIAAEGYSQQGQESLYFLEINDNNIINEFVYNEGGNELDPFAILEIENDILIGGFVKNRELISNSFYNMYSEKQMIYIGRFTKFGKKIWSRAIDLNGYENGICNSMIKSGNHYFLLCHSNRLEKNMTPFILKIDSLGQIVKIIELDNNNITTIGSLIINNSNVIELHGSYTSNDKNYLYKMLLSQDLDLINVFEYQIPNNFIINGIDNSNDLFGGILNEGGGFNNCIISPDKNGYLLKKFGSEKSDLIFGINSNLIFSYTMGSSLEQTSTINIFNKELNFESVFLPEVNSKLNVNSEITFKYIDNFLKSSINKGVGKVKISEVKINSKQ